MARIRIGLVGTGQRGRAYMRELVKAQDIDVACLCDAQRDRLEAFAAQTGASGATLTTELDALLSGDLVEAVIVAVPDRFHKEVAVRAFEAGKHVLIEKPMALTIEDCRAIARAKESSGCMLQVAFVLRHTPFYAKVKEVVDTGALGQIMSLAMTEHLGVDHSAATMRRWHRKRENCGSFLMAKCCHDLDVMNWLLETRPVAVASFGDTNFFTPAKRPATHCSACPVADSCPYRFDVDADDSFVYMTPTDKRDPSRNDFDLCVYNDDKDIVDNQVCILEFANDVRATFSLQCFHPGGTQRTITIAGSQAYLTGCYEDHRFRVAYSRDDRVEEHDVSGSEVAGGHLGGDRRLVRDLAAALRGELAPATDWRDGLASDVVGIAIERARETKTVVRIDPEDYAL